MASCPGIGLTYHLTRLAIGLKNQGLDLVVLSDSSEQVSGLSNELAAANIPHFVSKNVGVPQADAILRAASEISAIIRKECVTVIHAQGTIDSLNAYLATRSFRFSKKPFIVTSIHAVPNNQTNQLLNWRIMVSVLNKATDLVLPVSFYTKESLINHGLNPRKVITVHNALDLSMFDKACLEFNDCFSRESGLPLVVCVANLIPGKGQEYFLRAAYIALKKNDALFYVVGDGPLRKNLEQIVHRLGIGNNVVFAGRIQWPSLYPFLKNVADICVSPSISENFPYCNLEFMAASKPIIAANVGGVSEAIKNGVTGYLVPPKDDAALARHITSLVSNMDQAKLMGQCGRTFVKDYFSMPILSAQLSKIYGYTKESLPTVNC